MESERSSRQKAEKDLLEMEKLIGSLRVDVSQYEQRAATVTQELTAETDKVDTDSAVTLCQLVYISILVSLELKM